MKDEILSCLPDTGLETTLARYVCMSKSISCTCMQSVVFSQYISHRPKWIKIYGQEYHVPCCVQTGWQPDDLPVFGSVKAVIVIVGAVLLQVNIFLTEGINSHLSSYNITPMQETKVILLSSLENKEVYYTHRFLGDKQLYITVRSHIERTDIQ